VTATTDIAIEQDVKAPPTGADYLESIRDGRVIYFDGERVDDVTTHPAFANTARTIARMYDTLHDPAKQDVLTFITERNTRSHKFYKLPLNSEDLFGARDAIAEWARLSYGILSRGPDYKASVIGALAGDADYYGDFAPNIRRWYEKVTDEVMFLNLSLVNPAGDRKKRISEQKDVVAHVVKERDDGIVVRGLRMISTGAAFSHTTYVSQYISGSGLGQDEADLAFGFFVPFNAPGVKLIGRYSYEYMAKRLGSPFDYPLSSRFDETDYSLVLDDVFIPWENVTAYRMPDQVNSLFPHGFAQRFALHAASRTAVKMDFLCGLLLKAVETTQVNDFRGVQATLGEIIGLRHEIWAYATAMCAEPMPGPGGYVLPNVRYALQWRNAYGDIFSKVRLAFHNLIAGGLIQIPSSARDFKNDEIRPWLDNFWKTPVASAEDRVKLMRLIWDVFFTEFGGRGEMHERSFAGGYESNRVETYFTGEAIGDNANFRAMVDQCLSEYDLNGWTEGSIWPEWQNV